jgi:MerR family transcriptional regulator/heat shock protein HspR
MEENNEINLGIDGDMPLYAIGVVAELLQISVQTLRLYESEGLVIPFKKDSHHRLYSQNDIVRLRCIRDAITNKKFSISAIKTIYSLIPCWSIKNCSEEQRQKCPAYNSVMAPCWTINHSDNVCESDDCRTCQVYTEHSNCESIKETIKKYTVNA